MIRYKGWIWMVRGCFSIENGFLAFPRYSGKKDVVLKEPEESLSLAREIAPETIRYISCIGREAPILRKDAGTILNPLNLNNIEKQGIGEIALELVGLLRKLVGTNNIGITGGLLAGRRETGDIDIIVYGEKECRETYNLLSKKRLLQKYTMEDAKRILKKRGENLFDNKIIEREKSKVLQGKYRDVDVYVRLVPCTFEKTWSCHYTVIKEGVFTSRVLITDDTDSMIYPCRYRAVDLEGRIKGEFYIKSDRGRYCELLRKGEIAYVRGDLETVLHHSIKTKQVYLWKKTHYLIPG